MPSFLQSIGRALNGFEVDAVVCGGLAGAARDQDVVARTKRIFANPPGSVGGTRRAPLRLPQDRIARRIRDIQRDPCVRIAIIESHKFALDRNALVSS